jgi:hypothetical protein
MTAINTQCDVCIKCTREQGISESLLYTHVCLSVLYTGNGPGEVRHRAARPDNLSIFKIILSLSLCLYVR